MKDRYALDALRGHTACLSLNPTTMPLFHRYAPLACSSRMCWRQMITSTLGVMVVCLWCFRPVQYLPPSTPLFITPSLFGPPDFEGGGRQSLPWDRPGFQLLPLGAQGFR